MLLNWVFKSVRNSPAVFGAGLVVGVLVGAAASHLLTSPNEPSQPTQARSDRKAFRRARTIAELESLAKEVRNGD